MAREFDIVVLGASGFTGTRILRYLGLHKKNLCDPRAAGGCGG